MTTKVAKKATKKAANWEQADIQGSQFFYRVCRENLKLTLEADKLLRLQ